MQCLSIQLPLCARVYIAIVVVQLLFCGVMYLLGNKYMERGDVVS